MIQMDKAGSQLLCLVRGRGCVTMAILLTVVMVINMVLLSVVINTEMVAKWHIYHGNQQQDDRLAWDDKPENNEGVENVHTFHKKHHKNTENTVEDSKLGQRFIGDDKLHGFEVEVVRTEIIPSSPQTESSDIQVAVIASEVPPKSEKNSKSDHASGPGVPSLFLAQARTAFNMANQQEQARKDSFREGPFVSDSHPRDPGYMVIPSEPSGARVRVGGRAGRQTRHIQSVDHDHRPHTEGPVDVSTAAKQNGDDTHSRKDRSGTKDKPRDNKQDDNSPTRKQDNEKSSKGDKIAEVTSKQHARSRARFTLNSLATEPDQPSRLEDKYPAYKSRRESRRELRAQRKQQKNDDNGQKNKDRSKRKGKQQEEDGEAFSNRDIKTFQKHLDKKERRLERKLAKQSNDKKDKDSKSQSNNNKDKDKDSESQKQERSSKSNKEERRKTKSKHQEAKDGKSGSSETIHTGSDNNKVKVIHEYNVEHKTDEDWEPHEDMSSSHLLLADRK